MNEYREGDRVRITIDAVIVNTYPHTRLPDANGQVATDHVVVYRTDAQEGQSSSVALEDPAVTIERADPEWWPPRPGDLLREGERLLWFAYAEGSNVLYRTAWSERMEHPEAWEKRHELTLVHREDEQDGGAS